MKKLILFAVSFFSTATATWAQQAGTQTVVTDNVPVEEYVPKVIIEGKWGTGPGEFGAIDPMQADHYRLAMSPTSLAVNSKGDIYVLDHINNRIQKFKNDGTYVGSISVYGLADNTGGNESILTVTPLSEGGDRFDVKGTPSYIGINIVIDSKDTLYYYLKRVKDSKETGEVWEFRKDKLVRKFPVPLTNYLSSGVGLELDKADDSLLIPEVDRKNPGKHYDVRGGKIFTRKEILDKRSKFMATEAGKKALTKVKPKYYLDIVTSDAGVKIVQKRN